MSRFTRFNLNIWCPQIYSVQNTPQIIYYNIFGCEKKCALFVCVPLNANEEDDLYVHELSSIQ